MLCMQSHHFEMIFCPLIVILQNRNVPCYKRCKQMEYKASQELLLDSEDPEVSFWISLTDETYFNSFE